MEIIDYLLARKKAGGGSDVTIEQLNVTENGTYSEEGIAYSPVVVNVPAPANSYQLKDVPSGTVSTIDDGTALPMPSLKVGIEPVQDLHGYGHPWAEGAGKNLLQNVRSTTTINGITFTVNNDGSIFIPGGQTASDLAVLNLIANDFNYYNLTDFGLSYDTDYIINGCPAGGTAFGYRLVFRSGGSAANYVDYGGGVNFNISSASSTLIWMPCIIINKDYTIPSDGLLFKPMIRLATETDATFEPYSNICPISGWTAANVMRTGKNLFDKTAIEKNKWLNISTGEIESSDGYAVTAPIKVEANKTITTTYPYSSRRWLYDNNGNTITLITSNTFTPSQDGYIRLTLALNDVNLDTFQVEQGTTATTYEPYNGQTYTIQFKDGDNPLTVYGGTLDVTSGELVVDRVEVDLGDLTWIGSTERFNSAGISNFAKTYPDGVPNKVIFEKYQSKPSRIGGYYPGEPNVVSLNYNGNLYSVSETTPTGKCVYELAEPITYQLTPTQVRTLVGNNNIWADTGDIIEGKYFKSLT